MKQLFRMAQELDAPVEKRREFFHAAVALFQEHSATISPPELAAYYFDIYTRYSGIEDSYTEIKMQSTELARAIYPELEKICRASGDREFMNRVKLAISGNVIDYGVNPDFDVSQAEKQIREVLDMPCDMEALRDLKKRLSDAGNILYILDNCGEAVLDRLLLDTVKGKVTIAVRGRAIINDITRREVEASNLSDFPLIDTGCNAPGAPLKLVSPEFRAAMDNADLIIAKGQGNFESLEHEYTARPIYFLFRAKCRVIQNYINAEAGSLQIRGKNLS